LFLSRFRRVVAAFLSRHLTQGLCGLSIAM
jgi:hypothetical protein